MDSIKAAKLDAVLKRLHMLKAPKAREWCKSFLYHNEWFDDLSWQPWFDLVQRHNKKTWCFFTWWVSNMVTIIQLHALVPPPELLLGAVVLLAMNQDVETFTEATNLFGDGGLGGNRYTQDRKKRLKSIKQMMILPSKSKDCRQWCFVVFFLECSIYTRMNEWFVANAKLELWVGFLTRTPNWNSNCCLPPANLSAKKPLIATYLPGVWMLGVLCGAGLGEPSDEIQTSTHSKFWYHLWNPWCKPS